MHLRNSPKKLRPLTGYLFSSCNRPAPSSRLLAKQLEESEKQGRRLSRLPPLTMESPLIVQGRSDYFRSMSVDEGDGDAPLQDFVPQPSPRHVQLPARSPDRLPAKKNSFDSATGLVPPPRSSYPKRSSSIISSPLESTDEDGLSSMNASGLPRPSYNFSRPMSRAGTPGPETPGLETPARQASMDSHTSFVLQDDAASTPTLHRSSGILLDSQPQAQFQYGQPTVLPATNLQTFPISGGAPPSPPTIPGSPASSVGFKEPGVSMESDRAKLSVDARRIDRQPSPDPSRASSEAARQSEDAPRGRPLTSPLHDAFMKPKVAASTTTSDSASTIRAARSQQSNAPTMNDMSAEEHLAKAIALHESGALQQSTYHLRFAARQGHPTGMLLYALACRHGWGMRANPREGVQWLRRAADSAQIEIADDEDQAKEGKAVDVVERKTRKAQFALSIYELGVSHMNGWGIEQDKALALRCFEIAGSWGDVDALAEAGFCYAQGVGCKKNLMKSAHFYRQAEAKGMSMVGNSWIHKAKYNEDAKGAPKSDGKTRSKSRNRKGLFGGKKNVIS
ncbi:hypothetical protein P8C59_007125 [Phyllachora maydis]|uniref:Uncharacterized protein n=1 Tax=Phyllachora maydis TaxID=1825666 RepID=A0AAD9I8X8_9PEZI|nr:hypothetical protein P8C59_007125 [Phyllachora maydis]